MRIAMIATGSRGDVQPYVALGKGLGAAGHEVRLITHENFGSLVQSQGVGFWPVEGNVQDVAQSEEMRERIEKGNFLLIMRLMAKAAEEGAVHLVKGGMEACHDADLILGGMGGEFTGVALAEKFNLPFLPAYLVPFTPTKSFASVLLPAQIPVPSGILKQASHTLTRQLMWQSFRSADRVARKNILGLPAAPFLGPYNSNQTIGNPVLYGYSPSVIPKPPDWPYSIHVTGYWFLDSPTDWEPPDDLVAFMDAGSPPIYIGFGSMAHRNPQETTELILQALGSTEQRAILLSGWGGMDKFNLPDSVYMIDSLPHSWVFPKVAAVVHHGGVGTTAAGLRAGVPSVIVPFFGDQPFWGDRIAKLGVGPKPIPRKRLTPENLSNAINAAISDNPMRQQAAKLGMKIRAEDGIGNAVNVIDNFAHQYAS